MKKLAGILLLFWVTAAEAQPSYWWQQLQRKPDAAQSQAFWFVPGQGIFFTYQTNRVIINATGGGGGTTNYVAGTNITFTYLGGGVYQINSTGGGGPSAGLTTNLNVAFSGGIDETVSFSNGLLVAVSAPLIHPTVTNWAGRVVAHGGTNVSLWTQKAVSTFCYGLDAYGLTSKMIAVNCMVPDNLIAVTTPLIVGSGSDPWVNTGFVTGDVTINGLVGADNKYFRTGLIPSVIYGSVNEGGLTFYCYASPNNGPEREIASTPAGGSSSALLVDYQGNTYFDAYTDGGSGRINLATPTPLAFYSGSRTDSTHEYLYYATSSLAFARIAGPGGAPGASLPAIEYYVMAMNNNGAPANYTHKTGSFVAIHHGLTATETEELYTLVQAMRITLGGGWK
jgi:hypothetical protein